VQKSLARALTIIETAKLNGLQPTSLFSLDILTRIHDSQDHRLDDLLARGTGLPMAAQNIKAA